MQAVAKYRGKAEAVVEKETGHFMPMDSRKEVALELKRAHFVLGSDKSDFRSKNEVQQSEQNWNIDQDKSKFGTQIKQSHVQIGFNNKFSNETTHQQDFNKKSSELTKVVAALETKQDLRKSHFAFGSESGPDNFTTTNQERFKKSNMGLNLVELKSKANEVERSKIVYGTAKPSYQSSMKESMVKHDLAQSYKNLQQQHEQGKNVRRHNFQLGYDNNQQNESEYQSISNNDRSKSVMIGPSVRAAAIRQSNIEIGNRWENNDYTSSTKMAQQTLTSQTQREDKQSNPLEQADKTKQDLRKSHFQIGNTPMVLESLAKGSFKNVDIDPSTQKQKQAIQNKMQKGNFSIGEEKNRSMAFETTYKNSISSDKQLLTGSNNLENRNHLFGSISLGSHQTNYVSEAKTKFMGEQGAKDNTYQAMIGKNRPSHFTLGDGQSQELTTVMKSQYDYKGNPNEIRQSLDDNTKADLRQHHFSMGSHSTEYKTSALKNNNNEPQTVTGGYKIEAKSLLKNSGQRIFGGNNNASSPQKPGEYKTTNQSFIKWIQPAPTQIQMNMGALGKP